MTAADGGEESAAAGSPRAPRRWGGGRADPVLLVNGMLVGVAGVFVTTASVFVTVVAAVAAMILGVAVMLGGGR